MKIFPKFLKILFYLFLLIVCFFIIINFISEPSNERDWNDDQKILPYAEINGNLVSVYNIRNFSYTSTSEYTRDYYDKIFDLDKIKKVWYIVEPFSGIPGSAHTFLSFEFEDDKFLSISVEIRKEKGETYSPIKGLFNQYEIMYVIADEKDVIKLRSNYRKDFVYVYPVETTTEKIRKLFLSMIERVNNLKDNPEFYNTITNTCTTNIVVHINEVTPNRVPLLNLRILLPENSDKLGYELGLISNELSFEETRKKYFINDRAMKYANDEDFSLRIRE